MTKILIVEDDKDTATMITEWLSAQHYVVEVVHDGAEGLERLLQIPYEAAVIDWNLPSMQGPEICRRYRMKNGTIPILLLTARMSIEEKEKGFDSGADDYLTKPFDVRELSARLTSMLRRPGALRDAIMHVRDIELDSKLHEVTKSGQKINILPVDFLLLEFLMRHPNEVFTEESLRDRVWPTDKEVGPDAVRSSVKRLRKALDTDSNDSIIQNIHKVGYKVKSQ